MDREIVSVLIVGLSYGARNVLSYTRGMMQNFLAFRDSPIIPLRRSPREIETGERWRERGASGRLVGKFHKGTKINTTEKERELLDGLLGPRRCCLFATFCRINIPAVRTSPTVTAQYASFNFTQPAS